MGFKILGLDEYLFVVRADKGIAPPVEWVSWDQSDSFETEYSSDFEESARDNETETGTPEEELEEGFEEMVDDDGAEGEDEERAEELLYEEDSLVLPEGDEEGAEFDEDDMVEDAAEGDEEGDEGDEDDL